jgi:hypothetical protein
MELKYISSSGMKSCHVCRGGHAMVSKLVAEAADGVCGGVEGDGGVVVVVVCFAVYEAVGSVVVALLHVWRSGEVEGDKAVGCAGGSVGDGAGVLEDGGEEGG